MSRELPAGARVAILATSACILFAAVATASTAWQPYAPNDWAFSHVVLAQQALDTGHIAFNDRILEGGAFSHNHGAFARATGLDLITFYASTMWHFWNGLPLHPALVATLAAGTGLSPEDTMRVPLAGFALVTLAYASAALALARLPGVDTRLAVAAPFLLAIGCAPFALDLRVLMPSTTLVMLGVLLHMLLRRRVLDDRQALAVAFAPLVLLPFWYYTVSYFVIVLLVGFLVADLAMRWRLGKARPVLVPTWSALLLVGALVGALLLNGALSSHLKLAQQMSGSFLAPDAGSDYVSHLNRQPWRSALLYAEIAMLFAPLVVGGILAARRAFARQPLDHPEAVLAPWGVGGAAFSAVLFGTVGISFLNRSVIYFAPLAAVAATVLLARMWRRRVWRVGALAAACALLLVTTTLVATATPSYQRADAEAYTWVGATLPKTAVVYAPLEVGSVLFRDHGMVNTLAFYPQTQVLEEFWYGTEPKRIVPYAASFDSLVVRKEMARTGFEEFGPLRQPIGDAAYGKFAASRDLDLVFDNGEVQVYRVAIEPVVLSGGGG